MGTIKEGINGPFSGKAGGVIGSRWRQIAYIKGLPRRKKGYRPTAAQQLNQQKFLLLGRFLSPLSAVLETSMAAFTDRETGVNAAVRLNFDRAFRIDNREVALDYSALQLSYGSLAPAGEERASLLGQQVRVSWDPETYGIGRAPDDVAYAIIYNEANRSMWLGRRSLRMDGGTEVDLLLSADRQHHLHAWLFFVDRFGRRASRTVYVPITEI